MAHFKVNAEPAVENYTPLANQVIFPLKMQFFMNSDIVVYFDDSETPVDPSLYTTTGEQSDFGMQVEFNDPPINAGVAKVTFVNEAPVDRTTDFGESRDWSAKNVNDEFDRQTLLLKRPISGLARALQVPLSDIDPKVKLPAAAQRAGFYLGFDGNGDVALLAGTAESADISDKTVVPTGWSSGGRLDDILGNQLYLGENIKYHGAKGDYIHRSDGTVTDGSDQLSSAGLAFNADDVGKKIFVEACASGGIDIGSVRQAPIDACYQFDASFVSISRQFVDLTDDINDAGGADVNPFPDPSAVDDAFYIGHAQQFDGVTIDIATSGTVGVVAWEYWDGSAWVALTVTDDTNGFTAAPGDHDVTFTPPVDWETTQVGKPWNGKFLYYIRARVTTPYTVHPVLDDALLMNGRIEIETSTSPHFIEPNQKVTIKGVLGTTEANGTWEVERIGNTILQLIGPSFANAYTSGGTIHGRLETTISTVSGGVATLGASAGATVSATAEFGFGTDDTLAIQAAIDTGKTVFVPDGDFFTGEVHIDTDGQKLIGMGGTLVCLPATVSNAATSDRGALVSAEANNVEICGLKIDNPSLGNRKESTWPESINVGISIVGSGVNVHHNNIRRMQGGIVVAFSEGFLTGPEYEKNTISDNICWELLGAGSGKDERIGIQGEDRGDGIVSWGAATVITNNIVQPRIGADCRIGLHVEGLSDRFDPDNPVAQYIDSGAVISNNFVMGHGLDIRNGRFRRSITTEQVRDVLIANNVVYGGGWAGIEASLTTDNDDDNGSKGNVSITGNIIRWTRPDADKAGLDWSPIKALISVRSNSTDANRGVINVSISGNSCEIKGHSSYHLIVRPFQIGAQQGCIAINGNSFLTRTGLVGQTINTTNGLEEFVFSGNTIRQHGGGVLVRLQSNGDYAIINNNVLRAIENTSHGVQASNAARMIVSDNIIENVLADAIQMINGILGIATGNIIENIGSDGIDGFGLDQGICGHNIFVNIGDLYLRNWGAPKLDVDNVKV